MKILARMSRLISANINHLLDQAEDPEVMVKEISGTWRKASLSSAERPSRR